MHAYEFLRWAGVVALGVLLAAGIVPFVRRRPDMSQSVSQVWSAVRHPRLFGTVLTAACSVLCAYILGWLLPTYRLSWLLYILVVAGLLAVPLVAWVPMRERPGEHSLRHPHFVGGAAGATVIVLAYIIIIAAPAVGPLSHWLAIAGLLYGACWPLFFTRPFRRYFLPLEGLFVVLLASLMLALTMYW